ncbi:hypothetical protein [Lactococcus termiticola]|uniref:hypothetical protein n=1 Tax=Lactococcus termiticola TaxID=2169526 RepID=UPI000D659EC3|nr:hypothetical protein [Lactococcus termiticola]
MWKSENKFISYSKFPLFFLDIVVVFLLFFGKVQLLIAELLSNHQSSYFETFIFLGLFVLLALANFFIIKKQASTLRILYTLSLLLFVTDIFTAPFVVKAIQKQTKISEKNPT